VSAGTRTLEHEVRIAAPPEAVFPFFTDPAKMVRWMGNEATIDPRPGGVCRVGFVRDAAAVAMSGVFEEVVPHSRVVFTWGWEPELFNVPPASTRVEVSLEPDGDGTLVKLVHTELPEESIEFHSAGWSHYLPRLGVAAVVGDLGPDDWVAPALRSLLSRG
jgi:uncharacterized protein YndB with AHSA1/START domain